MKGYKSLWSLTALHVWPVFVEFSLSGQAFGGWDQFKKFGGRYGEAIADPHNAFERNAAYSTLNPSDVVGFIAAKLRQPLLGDDVLEIFIFELGARALRRGRYEEKELRSLLLPRLAPRARRFHACSKQAV